ncbi:MAG: glycosyltransferase family 9 protein [Elusimicrobiota bacterium]
MKLDYNFFVHKRNFYLLILIDRFLYLIFKICAIFKIPKKNSCYEDRILLLEPAHLGDVLLTTPAIRYIKEANPDKKIICLLSSAGAIALKKNNNISSIHIIDLPWYNNSGGILKSVFFFFKLIKALHDLKPKAVINFRTASYHREHLAMWLSGVPERIGVSHKGFGFLLSKEIPYQNVEQAALQKLKIIEKWLGERFDNHSIKIDYFINETARESADKKFKNLKINQGKIIVGINPSAQHKFLWPQQYYIALCKALYKDLNSEILFIGTSNFKNSVSSIQKGLGFNTYSLVGETTLDEVSIIIQKLDMLITEDTGIRYISGVYNIPTYVLRNGANSSIEFGQHIETEKIIVAEVPCSPCGKKNCPLGTLDCMVKITPELVFQTIRNDLPNHTK